MGRAQQAREAKPQENHQQRNAGRGREATERGVVDGPIAAAEQPCQRQRLQERTGAEVGRDSRLAIANVHQGQRPENHERSGARDRDRDEQQREEQNHVRAHDQNSAWPGARG
jgi:hypothetical protein